MTTQLTALGPIEPPPVLPQPRRPAAAIAAPAPAAEPVLPNPQLRLDASLGLVVLEFRDFGGRSRTIPTERELDAYRNNAPPPGTAVAEADTPGPSNVAVERVPGSRPEVSIGL